MERKIKFNDITYKKLEIKNFLKESLFIHNSEEYMSELVVKNVVKRFKDAKNPAIICVGTKKAAFDSFGPILYDAFINLGVDKKNIYWFHGANADKIIPIIKSNNHDVSIAFDAEVLTSNNDIMKLRFRDLPIAPGAGCGKCIEKVGDFSITMPIGHKNDLRTIIWNDHLIYDIKDIEKISQAFAKVFLEKVSKFYNFVKEPNKNLG